MGLVTLSASYGAGGSRVGPELAKRLGVPFLDRSIPAAVAERLAVPMAEALTHDQSVGNTLERLLSSFASAGTALTGEPVVPPLPERTFAQATEQVIHECAEDGAAVILGRAAGIVLADDPRVLRVRMDGPVQRRIEQAMALQNIGREVAERRMEQTDRAREAYVHHFYRRDVHDCTLYELVIDSTAIGLDACVELIALAARARR